jgi:ParB family chromosome partitioning protein
MDNDFAELATIDENLTRSDLEPGELAYAMARRKALYEQFHPETKATKNGGPGRAKETHRNNCGELEDSPSAERFTLNTAKVSGDSERKVQRLALQS